MKLPVRGAYGSDLLRFIHCDKTLLTLCLTAGFIQRIKQSDSLIRRKELSLIMFWDSAFPCSVQLL